MKKKTILLIAGGILFICIAVLLSSFLIKRHNTDTLVEQQNFVASQLLEAGKYSAAESLALQSEQMKSNAVSRELIVLAKGFQANCSEAQILAETYLTLQEDDCMEAIRGVCETYLADREKLPQDDMYEYEEQCNALAENARRDFLRILLEVEGKIDVKKSGESLRNLVEAYYEDADSYYGENAYLKQVPDGADDTLLGRKIKAVYALQYSSAEDGMEQAKKLLQQSDAFEHRAIVANYVAKDGYYTETQNNATGKAQDPFAASAQCAINYIETTTPVYQRDTQAYQMELAYLYYRAGKEEKARKLLTDAVKRETVSQEPVSMLIAAYVRLYRQTGENFYNNMLSGGESTEGIWKQISRLMGFWSIRYDDADNFYDFWLTTLDGIFNSLIIRSIDTTQYPTVAITVNVAKELDEALTKEDFRIEDLGIAPGDFELHSLQEDDQIAENLYVDLVVDHSGSMEGTPLEDTQKAVSNFVKNAESGIQIGLVEFDDRAEVVASITASRNVILQGINTISAGGGTSIYSGLELAGNELAGKSGRRVIILLSDGEDGDTSRIDEVLVQLKKQNIVVYTIGFGGVDTQYLSYIANACNGKFIQAESSDMLGEIYAEVGQFMANDYLITFLAETEVDRYDRSLRVELDKEDAFAEQDYNVGVTAQEIQTEENLPPMSDYFQETGGSRMDIPVQP